MAATLGTSPAATGRRSRRGNRCSAPGSRISSSACRARARGMRGAEDHLSRSRGAPSEPATQPTPTPKAGLEDDLHPRGEPQPHGQFLATITAGSTTRWLYSTRCRSSSDLHHVAPITKVRSASTIVLSSVPARPLDTRGSSQLLTRPLSGGESTATGLAAPVAVRGVEMLAGAQAVLEHSRGLDRQIHPPLHSGQVGEVAVRESHRSPEPGWANCRRPSGV